MSTLTVEHIVERARALTDVEDPDPSHFVENLDAVVRAMNDEAALTPQAVDGTIGRMAVALRNRMEVDRYVADEPGIDASTIERPIFLTGLPRSGTTYFQYLFDQDPTLRMLRTWEGDRPVPPPAVDPESARRRLAASAEQVRQAREAMGGKIDAMHLTDVDGPQECLAILDQTFVNPGLLWTMSVPGYLEHLLHDADLRSAYEHHARVLRLLQWGAPPRRWTLKWPCHLLALDAIAAVYPDARFVVTHRDPVQALASNCSLTHMLRAGTSPSADPQQIGRDMLELVGQHVDRLVAFDVEQERTGGAALVHVDYYRLVDAPEEVMPEVFASIGLEWSSEVEQRIRAWRDANPKGKRGTHEYTLDDYGLSRATVAGAFAEYLERFDVPSEDAQRVTHDDPLGWIGCLDDLRRVAERLAEQAGSTTDSAREVDVAVKVFGVMSAAYLTHLWAEPDHPAFLPSVGYHQMYGSPNPDTIYRNAAIDSGGTYRIVGHRGTAPDVTIMAFGPPVAGGLQTFAPFDLDDLVIDDDGTFDVVLGGDRPAAARNWWRLEPGTRTLMLRSVSDQWGRQVDPRIAIVRLDVEPRRERAEPAALQRRFQSYATVVEAMVMSGVTRVARLRDDAVVNRVVTVDYSGTGGGLDDQWYHEGCFSLGDREVLLVETHLDPTCTAFSLSLTDAAFSTIDWANAQSSLNHHQAAIDADGVLRVVVAPSDPGVHNWLDTTGHGSGVMQFRWSGIAAPSDVSVRVVAVDVLDDALPAASSRVSPAERADVIRARQVGVQLRTRW